MPSGTSLRVAAADRRLAAGVAVGAEALHRAHRAHAAVALVAATLEQLHLARALLGAGEQRAEHHGLGAGGDRLDDVAGVRDAAIGDDRDAQPVGPPRRVPDRRQLRHAGATDHPRRADRAGPDADLDGVGPGLGERLDALLGDDVAGDDRQRRPAALDPLDGLDHAGRVAVGGVDGDGVTRFGDERLDPLLDVVADTDGGRAAQPAGVVTGGVRELLALLDVLHRDQPGKAAVVVDEGQLLDAVALQDRLRLRRASCRPAPCGGARTS